MSGGSHNYIYSRLSSECQGEMHDVEMNDLIKDLIDVLHDLEWWQSGDYSEDQYRETVSEFKKKWFKSDRQERLRSYIDDQIDVVRDQLYSLIGEAEGRERMNRDLSKFEPPKTEPDGLTKELFGLPIERTPAKKSDFNIVDSKTKVDPCCGLYDFHITKKDIAALLSGKKLYSTVSYGEYAITIEMEDKE